MENFVSIGRVNGRHDVVSTENYKQTRIGPFETAAEALTVAASECDRLGLPPAYRGIPAAY
jgi:hypothetical protein